MILSVFAKNAMIGLTFALVASVHTRAQDSGPPTNIIADGIPAIPAAVRISSRPYLEYRTASFMGWDPETRAALILTRFGNTDQVHSVAAPGTARRQLSFEDDPIASAAIANGPDKVIYVSMDQGGNEIYQLYRLTNGVLSRLNDANEAANDPLASRDGALLGYSSPQRNGIDDDLYVMDPRRPESRRLVSQVSGSWWMFKDFSHSDRTALVTKFVSISDAPLFELDLLSGTMTPRGDVHTGAASYTKAKYFRDGSIIATSDADSDFIRLGRVDPKTNRFLAMNPETNHDVEDFAISPDGTFIAYIVNDDGESRLRIMDARTWRVTGGPALPAGRISNLAIAPWGEVGFTFASARSPDDVYAVNPKSFRVTRWTQSEAGGLDPGVNVEPQVLRVKSFDGTTVSGFLYQPDAKRFPGPRPLILNFHGGPESQFRPGFLGFDNYLINELGIALLYPNVRGSTGYGKYFASLDNGPFKREDAITDVGAILDELRRNTAIDSSRIAVNGISYGGYMALGSMVHYSDRLRAGLERVGISSFVTFLEHTALYRRELRRPEYGDERDPAQRAQLLAISPLSRAADIRIPLMAEAGANDPRVPASEAEAIVMAVRAGGGNAWLLVGENEGHHFMRKENRDYQHWAEIMFWREHLLSKKTEPWPAVERDPTANP